LSKFQELSKELKETNRKYRDTVTWSDILEEEVWEAFSETEPEKQREEMIHVATVAVQIIECLDRRMEEGK
jgi:hypothetical protein